MSGGKTAIWVAASALAVTGFGNDEPEASASMVGIKRRSLGGYDRYGGSSYGGGGYGGSSYGGGGYGGSSYAGSYGDGGFGGSSYVGGDYGSLSSRIMEKKNQKKNQKKKQKKKQKKNQKQKQKSEAMAEANSYGGRSRITRDIPLACVAAEFEANNNELLFPWGSEGQNEPECPGLPALAPAPAPAPATSRLPRLLLAQDVKTEGECIAEFEDYCNSWSDPDEVCLMCGEDDKTELSESCKQAAVAFTSSVCVVVGGDWVEAGAVGICGECTSTGSRGGNRNRAKSACTIL